MSRPTTRTTLTVIRSALLATAMCAATTTASAEPTKAPAGATDAAPAPAKATADPSAVEPPKEEWDNRDVTELPGKTYLFVGARYRGNVVPSFILNLFVDEGATVYSNAVGIELDIRKDGFSLIPALTFAEYGTGNLLFKDKNSKDIAGNYNLVNSSLKALYATADVLWSVKISKMFDFEYGAGFGLGIVFGDLVTNWVKEDPNGALRGSNGKGYSPCATVEAPGTGCNKADHQNSDIDRVGGYSEASWFNGGSKPVLFPYISIPQVGLRIKPVKQFAGRIGMGFGLTGFWFGFSGAYGLEQKPKP